MVAKADKPRTVRWSNVSNPMDWGRKNWIYFPFAEQFLKYCPWLAVRVFWLIIKVKDFFSNVHR